MAFCLPIASAQKFLTALKDGTINPEKLINMSSEERRDFFADIVGKDDAKDVNAMLESKLLLQDQKRGMVSWAKQLAGLKEPVRRDIIAKIGKMDTVLSETDQKAFLEDLAERKLGTHVSMEEANTLATMSKQVSEAKDAIEPTEPVASASRLDYGAKRVALEKYVNKLKLSNGPNVLQSAISNVKKGHIVALANDASKIGAFAKSMKAVGDISSLFRQGFKALFTNPTVWATNSVKTLGDVTRQLGIPGTNDAIMDGIKADIYSRPNALDGTYDKMKLAIGREPEEAIPVSHESLPTKIPLFGRLFKATQTGFEGFLYRTRADIADKYVQIAKDTGVDLNDPKELPAIGKLVNSLTGRGDLGKGNEVAKALNNVFFSPRFIKSNFDTLTAHQLQKDITPFARKQAALATLKIIGGTAAILGIAHAVAPNSVDFDPRNSNFGKIKVGKVSFDVSGGSGSLITLAARLIENSTKSSTTGKISPLNTGKFGAQTSSDVVMNFLTNKESPVASVITDLLNRKDFAGDQLGLNLKTAEIEGQNAFTPFPIQNVMEAMPQVGVPDAILAEIADAFGLYITIPTPPKKQ
jgi:hypothetical protein